MKLFLGVVGVTAFLASCFDSGPKTTANHPDMVRSIEAQGFKDVVLNDYGIVATGFEGCAESDDIVAHASATNAFGQRVHLIACSGFLFKGVTLRTK